MFKRLLSIILVLILISQLFAVKTKLKFYGSNESTVKFQQALTFEDDPDYGEFRWGWDNYTNLRFKANIGQYLKFQASFNLTMLAGTATETYQYQYYSFMNSVVPDLTSYYNPLSLDGSITHAWNSANTSFFSIPFIISPLTLVLLN
ncbi:MAG: hypothetical protein MJB14_10795 [Spirochaetes bacterium]|nr:hypothetical protein [Spirochaetota bacterium]